MPGFDRYARQLPMPEIGVGGQKRLARSSVLVVGCGGLGSALLYCLAGAGVGTIGFADGDTVSISNLNRQFLHTKADIGSNKAVSAFHKLSAFNPELCFNPIPRALTRETLDLDIQDYDLVVTAVDSLCARLDVNAACVRAQIPLIDGGVDGMYGTVLAVEPGVTPCLHCLFSSAALPPNPPPSFAPVVSVVSSLEAQLALDFLLGRPNPLRNRMLVYDGNGLELQKIPIARNECCTVCGNHI